MSISRREFIQAVGMAAVTAGLIGEARTVTVRVSDEEIANTHPAELKGLVFRRLYAAGAPIRFGLAKLHLDRGVIIETRLFDSRFTEYTWRAAK
jgi:hypothetical protein